MTSGIRKVTILGTGVLGSQIAYQTAYSGFEVTAYDITDDALAAARERFTKLATTYVDEVDGATAERTGATAAGITLTTDLAASVADADLVIEAVPEVLTLKQDIYRRLADAAPAKTVFATNSSTLLPSDIKDATGRPDRFLALHFANLVWRHNTGEVMGTADTDPAVFDRIVTFAAEIGMVPIPIHKEQAGYVLNSLLVPFLNAGAALAAFGVAEPKAIDDTWRIATGAPMGPFQMYDVIGLTTPYNILVHGDERAQRIAAWLKAEYIDQGKLGVASGEGFYTYS